MPESIQPIKPTQAQGVSLPGKAAKLEGDKNFQQVFSEFMDQYNQVQSDYSKSVEDLVTRKSDNVAEVVAAARKAELSNQLVIQLRNKIVDAYEEIMRMRI